MVRGSAEPRPLTDRRAFQAFYEQALPIVYGYHFARCGGDAKVAEDLSQETFMAAVAWIKGGGSVDAPLPWVVGIAKRKQIDHLRKQERVERHLALAWEAPPTSLDATDAPQERVMAALALVSSAQRAALTLCYVDGYPVAEAARLLGRSVRATESLLARGRESFRRAYAAEEGAT